MKEQRVLGSYSTVLYFRDHADLSWLTDVCVCCGFVIVFVFFCHHFLYSMSLISTRFGTDMASAAFTTVYQLVMWPYASCRLLWLHYHKQWNLMVINVQWHFTS